MYHGEILANAPFCTICGYNLVDFNPAHGVLSRALNSNENAEDGTDGNPAWGSSEEEDYGMEVDNESGELAYVY